MQIVIDIDDAVPMFNQLINQIKEAVISGGLVAGDPLPSIRQLANDLEINNKTVAKAYRLLERDSVIETKGYRGTFIHPQAKQNCSVDLNGWTIDTLDKAIIACKDKGVTDSEIRIAFNNLMNSKSS